MKRHVLLTLALLCAVPALDIAAGATLPTKHGMPDGHRGMLLDLKAPLSDGDPFAVTQRFKVEQWIGATLSSEKLEQSFGGRRLAGQRCARCWGWCCSVWGLRLSLLDPLRSTKELKQSGHWHKEDAGFHGLLTAVQKRDLASSPLIWLCF